MITFTLNGKSVQTTIDGDMPLLWFLRDELKLTGTKFGCGKGLCGACTLLVNHQAVRACITPVKLLEKQAIITIEAIDSLNVDGKEIGKTVQEAWQQLNVPQCGYCQSGQICSATALLIKNKTPSEEQINQAMSGNICRCGTYTRIRNAIHLSANQLTE